jgi:hypothetical protein
MALRMSGAAALTTPTARGGGHDSSTPCPVQSPSCRAAFYRPSLNHDALPPPAAAAALLPPAAAATATATGHGTSPAAAAVPSQPLPSSSHSTTAARRQRATPPPRRPSGRIYGRWRRRAHSASATAWRPARPRQSPSRARVAVAVAEGRPDGELRPPHLWWPECCYTSASRLGPIGGINPLFQTFILPNY